MALFRSKGPRRRRLYVEDDGIPVPWVAVLVAVFFMAMLNNEFWREATRIIPLNDAAAVVFHAALFIGSVSLYAFALNLLTLRFVGKGILVFLVMLAAGASFFMDTYGVRIDRAMIYSALVTDMREAADFWTGTFFWRMGLFGLLPAALIVWVRVGRRRLGRELIRRVLFGLLCVVLAISAIGLQYKEMVSFFRANRHMRTLLNPFNVLDATITLAMREWGGRKIVRQPLDPQATRAPRTGKPRLVALVVGEAARAQNFRINGYERNTNPVLEQIDIINYPDVASCGTSTAVSLPCMFSKFPRSGYTDRKAKEYENAADLLAHTGVRVIWRDNDTGGSKGVAERVGEERLYDAYIEEICNSGGCYDEILLRDLDARLAEAKPGEDILLVLHQKGSHGPSYFLRYPPEFKVFTPECRSTELQKCTEEEIRNTYDNTILYTDYILGQVVERLKKYSDRYDPAMIYVSDHGQSLGEYGLYLHGVPYVVAPKEQTHVPMLMWLPESFATASGIDPACLARNADRAYSHDNLFHSLLGVMQVNSTVYQAELDIFAQCRSR